MRPILLVFFILTPALVHTAGWCADPPDPWVGVYIKHGAFQDGSTVTITKNADGSYRISPYCDRDGRKFNQTRDGALSDGGGGLGVISIRPVEAADGKRARTLFGSFCYEQFTLTEAPGNRLGGRSSR